MKKIIFCLLCITTLSVSKAQDVTMRVVQTAYNATDPDGAGPATGTVTLNFEIMSAVPFNFLGFGIGFAFQSSKLIPTVPASTITPLGPLATANWNISPNLAGNPANLNVGGQTYDKRMIIGFNQGPNPSLPMPLTWTPFCSVDYWVTGSSYPQGGYFVVEPGILVATQAITDENFDDHQYLSPTYPTANPLGGGALPVLFTQFDAKCTNTGTLISWATGQESNSSKFEIERSANGTTWSSIGTVAAAGTSSSNRAYQQIDLAGGSAFYRIKQIDKDGQFIYTEVARTNCQVKNISSLIYPVPAKDLLNVVIKSDRSVRTQLMVYDLQGKLVKKIDASIMSGNNNFRINLTGLAAGDYMLRSNDAVIELNKVFTITR